MELSSRAHVLNMRPKSVNWGLLDIFKTFKKANNNKTHQTNLRVVFNIVYDLLSCYTGGDKGKFFA